MERLRPLNPNVTLTADTGLLEDKDEKYFSCFNVIVATCCKTEELVSQGLTEGCVGITEGWAWLTEGWSND